MILLYSVTTSGSDMYVAVGV